MAMSSTSYTPIILELCHNYRVLTEVLGHLIIISLCGSRGVKGCKMIHKSFLINYKLIFLLP